MSPYIYVFYVAFIVSFMFTPIMRSVAMYYGIIDQPDNLRKIHSKPVAYLGGVAVFLGWLAGLAFTQFLQTHGGEQASSDICTSTSASLSAHRSSSRWGCGMIFAG